jgi:thymidylate synthase (FAD)
MSSTIRPGDARIPRTSKAGARQRAEHANYSILRGVSRSLTHELVRHRLDSPTAASQRYVDESEANFVVPPAIIGDEALENTWREQTEAAQKRYVELVAQLMDRYGWVADKVHRRKMSREAARSVLPNATETKIVVTGNARAWRTMLELRSSEGAELEIRRCAVMLLRLLRTEAPGFFSDFDFTSLPTTAAARIGITTDLKENIARKMSLFTDEELSAFVLRLASVG